MTKQKDIPSTAENFEDMLGVQVTENTGTLHAFLGEPITPENEQEAEKMFLTPHDLARKEWIGMPEFVAEEPRKEITLKISFKSEEDKIKFGELINQRVSPKTKSIWWPELEQDQNILKRYIEDKD